MEDDKELYDKIYSLIKNTYYKDVERNIVERERYKTASDVFEILSQAAMLATAMVSAAAVYNKSDLLIFISALLSTSSTSFYALSKYLAKESKERNEVVNMIAKIFGIKGPVDIAIDISGQGSSKGNIYGVKADKEETRILIKDDKTPSHDDDDDK